MVGSLATLPGTFCHFVWQELALQRQLVSMTSGMFSSSSPNPWCASTVTHQTCAPDAACQQCPRLTTLYGSKVSRVGLERPSPETVRLFFSRGFGFRGRFGTGGALLFDDAAGFLG